jgi:misacylated tRNA(Ala) deacylase
MAPRGEGQDPDPNYLREFGARVIERGPDFVVLDRTAFYAEGGGQPDDRGALRWDGGETQVTAVRKEKGVIKHYVDRVPPVDVVHGVIDWDRRYAHMRMHTAQHLMSGVVWRIYAARTAGNQLHADRSRIDFQPANFTPDDLARIERECNERIAEGRPVRIYEEARVKLENELEGRAIIELIPTSIKRLRVIDIDGVDRCPCGGTHVRNTRELGGVRVLGKRRKGKETDRVEYELVASD